MPWFVSSDGPQGFVPRGRKSLVYPDDPGPCEWCGAPLRGKVQTRIMPVDMAKGDNFPRLIAQKSAEFDYTIIIRVCWKCAQLNADIFRGEPIREKP